MKDLYEYNTATEEECLEDLATLIEQLYLGTDDLDTLEKRSIRLRNIVERLKELRDEDNS